MGKHDLISGSLWEQYSGKVGDRMNNPRNLGELTVKDAQRAGGELVVAEFGAEACGDAVRLYLIVDSKNDKILQAKFQSFGCGTAIASSDVMAELCIGKTVDEALSITNIDVEHALRDVPDKPAIPPQKMHCSVMAYDVIKKAVSLYKGIDVEALEKEDMVCECARVTLKTVKDVIKLNDLTTVAQITQYTKAGAFCKSCIRPGGHEERKYYLEDILKETRLEMEQEKLEQQAQTREFSKMTLIQKHRLAEKILDENIRSGLVSDGGNVEIVDMKDTDDATEIFISYQGACMHCPSSKTSTLYAIEQALQSRIEFPIRVIIV
ncbi:MAG: iron-sulfur cluster assembly scaffold protein [Spirochaetales bacterium]|nr:iron-sulfur cluster assembly scaffold protein [Spirochaetales bacterium]